MFLIVCCVMVALSAMSGMALSYDNEVTYSGQGLIADGFGGYDLRTERCGVENGADVDGPYLLWVLTASKANNADITFDIPNNFEKFDMIKTGNGTFKYISGWLDPGTLLPDIVKATYDGNAKNAQLVVSHGCRPAGGGWCSPGFWKNATDDAWKLTGYTKADLFNDNVSLSFYGADLTPDVSLSTVLNTTGGTYKGPGIAGEDQRTQSPYPALNPFNAVGAFLTDQLDGGFDPEAMLEGGSNACPIDHFGNYKD